MPLYREVMIKNVYKDIRYYIDRGYLRYDFVVHPGGNPQQIRFALEGQYEDYIQDNCLVYTTRFGQVTMTELHTYQGKQVVPSGFVKQGQTYAISVGNYDPNQVLIIDPLIYSTYLGGSGDDWGHAGTIDGDGCVYVTGETRSSDFDLTPGAFQSANGGNFDVFITKLNPSGTGLVYSTYLGGSGYDIGFDIAIDEEDCAYITGQTLSSNFATTPGAFQPTPGGNADVFVAKLNPTGTELVYSTYLGSSGREEGRSIAVDGLGHAYVTGWTTSNNFPTTPGAFQTTHRGGTDAFVTKLNPIGTGLVYSTYLGGNGNDVGRDIVVSLGQVYVVGETSSTNLSTTPGAFQTTHGGGVYDAFVSKLNPTGTGLTYMTYLGGNATDEGYGIAIDDIGHAYVTGGTASANFTTTPGAFQPTHGGGFYDAFVTKINPTGTSLIYSTYLGGSADDRGHGITIDSSGNAYLTGGSISANFATTPGAFQMTKSITGDLDAFVTKLNATGTMLIYSTYLGGSGDDRGLKIAIDGSATNAYIIGYTQSTDFDITPEAFKTTNSSNTETFVTKLCLGVAISIALSSAPGTDNQAVCENTPIAEIIYNIKNAVSATVSGLPTGITADFSAGTINISGTPETNGIFNYIVTLMGDCGEVSASGTITIHPLSDVKVTQDGNTLTANQAGATYQWIDCDYSFTPILGATHQSYTPVISGSYAVVVTLNECNDTSSCQRVIVTSIKDLNDDQPLWQVYPNPNRGVLAIESNEAIDLGLYDIWGRQIASYEITRGINTLRLGCSRGIYFLRAYGSGKGFKIVVE